MNASRSALRFFAALTVLLSITVNLWHYDYPAALFWDENYHIASAQKYIHGVFFQEPHPPLGKLFIALGEVILKPNLDTRFGLDTDYVKSLPEGFSFSGYRLFPALFGFGIPIISFFVLIALLGNPLLSFLFNFIFIFDNAFVVHTRGAMLESPFLFFSMLAILLCTKKWGTARAITLGLVIGLAVAVKILALILILFPLSQLRNRRDAKAFLIALCMIPIPVIISYQIHFALSKTINPALSRSGYYEAKPELIQLLDSEERFTPRAVFTHLQESFRFTSHYQKGVPQLDVCKKGENGSPWYLWPLGGKTINYRWETPDGKEYLYLYLVSNPAIWWAAFIAVLLLSSWWITQWTVPGFQIFSKTDEKTRFVLGCLLVYWAYLFAIAQIDRVMYLYHYFLPLIFAKFLVATAFGQFLKEKWARKAAVSIALIALSTFLYYAPLTYYLPLTDEQVKSRALMNFWDLRCAAHCEK